MSDNFKVGVAAIFGAGSPAANWLVNMEPTLNVILIVCQIAVALATVVYIAIKCKNARDKKK